MISSLTSRSLYALALAGSALCASQASAVTTGPSSSQSPYIVPLDPNFDTTSVLTVGDTVPGTNGGTYRMVGVPDGLGAFSNDGLTFTVLSNHELTATEGIVRAHGAKGAFVSKYVIRKSDLRVVSGTDLIQNIQLWNPETSQYNAPTKGITLTRLCSADLPASSALFYRGLGTRDRIFFSGEESGLEGRAFAHQMNGTSVELPRMGNFSFENVVANPAPQNKTVVAGTDDGTGGQVYMYVGQKTNSGSAITRAGLTNGQLYGIKVTGLPVESSALSAPSAAPFTLQPLGNTENETGASLESRSQSFGVTSWSRPEDSAWDPSHPNDYYFVTTGSFTTNSRLWRLRFKDITQPELGGVMQQLLDGSEGQKMMDNICVTKYGQIIILEDPGNQPYVARVWRYDIGSGSFTPIAQHDPNRFTPGAPGFLTSDEESSGVISLENVLGPGKFMLDVQAHYETDEETVQGGQYLVVSQPTSVIKLTQTVSPQPFQLPASSSNLLDIEIKVKNEGAAPITHLTLRSSLWRDASLVAVSDANGNPIDRVGRGNSVTLQWNELKPGEEQTVVVTVSPRRAGTYKSTATISGSDYRNRSVSDRNTATIVIQGANNNAPSANNTSASSIRSF